MLKHHNNTPKCTQRCHPDTAPFFIELFNKRWRNNSVSIVILLLILVDHRGLCGYKSVVVTALGMP